MATTVPAASLLGATFDASGELLVIATVPGGSSSGVGDAIVALDGAAVGASASGDARVALVQEACARAGATLGVITARDAAALARYPLPGLHCARLDRGGGGGSLGVAIQADAAGRIMTGSLQGAAAASGCVEAGE